MIYRDFTFTNIRMKKYFTIVALAIFSLQNAQISTSTGTSNNKWTFGGGASVGFSGGNGGSGTTLGISPRVGYKVTENLEMGVLGSVLWNNSSYYSSTTFGIGPFANYYFSRSFYLSSLFQEYFFNQKNKISGYKYSGDEAALYLGAGYMQSIGGGAYMQIGASYNVLWNKNKSVFSSGFVPNIGFVIGL